MGNNNRLVAVVFAIAVLYLGTILFLYATYDRSPEVVMVYRQHQLE